MLAMNVRPSCGQFPRWATATRGSGLRRTHSTRKGVNKFVPAASSEEIDRESLRQADPTLALGKRAVLGFAAASWATATVAQSASAYATLSESLADLEEDLRLAEEDLAADPDDEIMQGQKQYFLDRIERLKQNAAFCSQTEQQITSGQGRFMQHAVIRVPDLEEAVTFWEDGLGALVTRRRTVNGVKCAFVAFGEESLRAPDGGAFALEILEEPGVTPALGQGYGYMQIGLSMPRVSKIRDSGGEIQYSYGNLEVIAPGGFLIKVYVAERRDPFELVALRCQDVEATALYYERVLGMQRREPPPDATSGTIFVPQNPKGSVLMGYGDNPKETVSILLEPNVGKNATSLFDDDNTSGPFNLFSKVLSQ
eukprot:scaffold401_cov399-Prasinococcus_capsulatus_cf.AAC.24